MPPPEEVTQIAETDDFVQEVPDSPVFPETVAVVIEDSDEEELVLMEESSDDFEDDFLALDEPEVPDIAVAPEPEPEPQRVINPPIVTAVSPPAPAAPEPTPQTAVAPPPPVIPPPIVTSPPPPPPVVTTPPQVTPPPATPPPVVAPSRPSPEPLPAPPPLAVLPPELPQSDSENELPYPLTDIREWQDDAMVFSRVVRATAGQMIEIPFRGTGWVYLGEAASRRGIMYDSRRLDPEGQSFIFRTQSPGEYALKFYRQDFIRDFILNDYVQVIVGAPPEATGTGWFNPPIDRSRVVAEPRWPSPLTEAQSLRPQPAAPRTAESPATAAPAQSPTGSPTGSPATQPTSPRREPTVPERVATVPPQTAVPPVQSLTPANGGANQQISPPPSAISDTPPRVDPETYLEKAKEEFDAGRIAAAIAFLDQFRGYYSLESDELLWLYGQFYEANSPSRDILTSLGYYRRLVDEYPQSSRYDDARRRIAYLQRYYINIH
jgi:hypothetical protein